MSTGAHAESPSTLLAGLLPPEVVWRAGRIDELTQAAHPLEAAAVARAVPRRQREFAAGRQCAREALHALCGAALPVLAGADRAPIWPAGVRGSITHNDVFCAAAVARADGLLGLGIDIDTVARFDDSLTSALCTPNEVKRWLDGCPEPQRMQRLATLFSVKEAFYKAQYAFSRAWLGFHDVEVVRWEARGAGLSFLELAVIQPPQARAGSTLEPAAVSLLTSRHWSGQSALDLQQVRSSVVMRP